MSGQRVANGATRSEAALVIFHDEDTEVYVNRQKIWSGTGPSASPPLSS